MTVDRIIALISSLGTFVATIIVFFTLLEMKKQRKNAMLPDLIFVKKEFQLYILEEKWEFIWTQDEIIENVLLNKKFQMEYFAIETFNIGQGSAKNILINWEFNIQGMLEMINKLDEEKQFEIEYAKGKLLSFKYKECKEKSQEMFLIENDFKTFIGHILSSEIRDQAVSINLPFSYIRLISLIIYLSVKKDFSNFNYLLENFPKLKMNITYYDIGKTKYEISYTLIFKLGSISKTKSILSIKGYIDYENIK